MDTDVVEQVDEDAAPDEAPAPKRKRKKTTTPTQRSLAYLRKQGYRVAVVEHWNKFAGIRQDLFGFIDILAIRRDETLAVQTTSGDHVAERIAKIAEHPNVGAVREANWKIHVHGWRKNAEGRWVLRIEDVS